MAKELKEEPIRRSLKEIIKKGEDMDLGNYNGLMEQYMRENGLKIREKGAVLTSGPMAESIRVNGMMPRFKV